MFASPSASLSSSSYASPVPSTPSSVIVPMAPFCNRSSRPLVFNERENPLSNPLVQRLFTAGSQVPNAPFLDRNAPQIPRILTDEEIGFLTQILFDDEDDEQEEEEDNHLFRTPPRNARTNEHMYDSVRVRAHRSPSLGGDNHDMSPYLVPFPTM